MKSSSYSAAVGKSKLRKTIPAAASRSFYWSVIRLVSGSLALAGMALTAQGQSQTGSSAAVANPAASGNNSGAADLTVPAPSGKDLPLPKTYKNEIGATADFMLGEGTVTLPIGYALQKALPGGGLKPAVISGNRSSVYYGGTISYSYGRSWYLDLSYEKGTSSGSQSIAINNTIPGVTTANFQYNDDYYQLYIRYNFQNLLQGTRFKAYLRGGVSLVEADLKINDVGNLYNQKDTTSDILGNLGFGLTYSLYARPRFKVGLQIEGEGFYGVRSQQSTETLPLDTGLAAARASLDNDLYGGVGRATVHADWRLGQAGRWRLTADVGVQYKYTIITYSGAGAPDETLWGPYAKAGVSYVF